MLPASIGAVDYFDAVYPDDKYVNYGAEVRADFFPAATVSCPRLKKLI
jgi:hypothetical protein